MKFLPALVKDLKSNGLIPLQVEIVGNLATLSFPFEGGYLYANFKSSEVLEEDEYQRLLSKLIAAIKRGKDEDHS
jgi:hypothetical protein